MSATNTAVILARVSGKDQEDGYSLDSQEKLLRSYCDTNELRAVRNFKIVETASKQHARKIFHELMAYMVQENICHLVVEKTDRLTRNLRDGAAIDDWIESDERRIVHSVKENIRLHKNARSDVKFMWQIHLAVAKKYTDNLREEAMKGWAEKLAQGWMPAPPPFGYRTAVVNGRRIHEPDPRTAPIIKHLFEIYLETNQTLKTVHAEACRLGLTTKGGNILSESALHVLIQNPFYMGTIRFSGKEYPGAHVPLITPRLFNSVQAKRTKGRPIKLRKHNVIFKNIMTCELCGKAITWQQQKGSLYGACQRDKSECKARKFIKEREVSERVERMLKSLVCPKAWMMDYVVQKLTVERQAASDIQHEARQAITARIKRLETMDETLYDDKLSGEISIERYAEKHVIFKQEVKDLKGQLTGLSEDYTVLHDENISIMELSQRALMLFKDKEVPIDDKRAILTKLFDEMTVDSNSVSVKYTKLARSIAKRNEESRVIMQTVNFTNQTSKNNKNNRGEGYEKSAKLALYPVWQGRQDLNLRHPVLETGALPTELHPFSNLACDLPLNNRVKRPVCHCSRPLALRNDARGHPHKDWKNQTTVQAHPTFWP